MADDRRTRPGVTRHRFFLPPESCHGERVSFPSETAHQIARVLRLRSGDEVIALDGSGDERIVLLERVAKEVEGTVVSHHENAAEPRTALTLYQGLLKGSKLELVLQKCTEIGAARFVPVITARSVPAELNPARLRRFESVVREAAEQSGRGRLPEIAAPIAFANAVQEAAGTGAAVLLWEEEQALRMDDLSPLGGAVGLFVGPEGGFTRDEAEQARAAGVSVVTLGPRILRAETAAVAGSALLLARWGEM